MAAPLAVIKYVLSGPCRVCGKAGSKACSRCMTDSYCGKEHQVLDWSRHKTGCGVLKLVDGHLEVAKDVPAGTWLFKELPMIVFPNVATNPGWVICFGCCSELGPAGDETPQCRDCGLPRCRPDCDLDGRHREECAMLQRAGLKLQRNEAFSLSHVQLVGLATLRVYMWARENWQMEEVHTAGAAEEFAVEEEQVMWLSVRDWLRQAGFHWLQEAALRRAFVLVRRSVVQNPHVHGANAKKSKCRSCRVMGTQALYGGRAMLKHSCVSNVYCHRVEETLLQEIVIASRDLKAGDILCHDSKTDPLQSAAFRRMYSESANCSCAVCLDAATLGLHMDSVGCTKCKGLVVPKAPAAEKDAGGRCRGCGLEMSAAKMKAVTAKAGRELEELEQRHTAFRLRATGPGTNFGDWEGFLKRHLQPHGPLHGTHWMALRAKQCYSMVVGAWLCNMGREHTTAELVRWEAVFRDVLRALEVLVPGMSVARFNVLAPFSNLLVIRAMHLHQDGRRNRGVFKTLMDESEEIQRDLARMVVTKKDHKQLEGYKVAHKIFSDFLSREGLL